jgi:hypothetical protein
MFRNVLFVVGLISFCTGMADLGEASRRKNRICFVSDLNGSYGSIELPTSVHSGLRFLQQQDCSIVIGAGDLVAGQDLTLSDSRLNAMWSEFKRVVMDPLVAQQIPFFSALGNHDASAARSTSGGYIYARERQVAQSFFQQNYKDFYSPDVQWLSREGFPFFYALRFANTGVVFIDGSSATELRTQRQWIEEQLGALARDSSVSARIVVGHLPLAAVASGRDRVGEILADSRELYELFDRNRVDLYVSGHHHAFYPSRVSGWSSVHGTVQLALGALGNGPRSLVGTSGLPSQNSITIIDVDDSIPWIQEKFELKTINPVSGKRISTFELPAILNSLDGSGRPISLERFDFREFFP